MFDSCSIVRLYEDVLMRDMRHYNIPDDAIRLAIESMAIVYKPDTVSLNSDRSLVADYNDVAHRCAYLHKYAAFHTAMVRDMFLDAIHLNYEYFSQWMGSETFNNNCFKVCSLGGGPGSDIIGALGALHTAFSFFPAAVVVVDYMYNWSYSFDSILTELGSGMYGPFGRYMCFDMHNNYIAANLLKALTPEVIDALSEASLVTMIKFASAAACLDTESMLKQIFAAMKPGAMVLFIDNDGGGFHQVFMDAAVRCNFTSVYGPYRHREYTNPVVKMRKFGYVSCHRTVVTVHIIQKSLLPLQCQSPFYGNPNRRVIASPSLLGPAPTPLLVSPPTPLLFRADSFVNDENLPPHEFSSPVQEIAQSPMSTPAGGSKGKTRRRQGKGRQGCFPIKNFRHHLAVKVNNLKAKARSVFMKRIKNKKIHPIFKI